MALLLLLSSLQLSHELWVLVCHVAARATASLLLLLHALLLLHLLVAAARTLKVPTHEIAAAAVSRVEASLLVHR